jgi:hypothetical protein
MCGRRVGLIMTGQNIDRAVMCDILAGRVPGRSDAGLSDRGDRR